MPFTLASASFLVLFGFALFIIGSYGDYTAVAVIGGLIIVGVGATAINQGGLEYQAGEQRTIVNETANKTVVDVDPEYRQVETPINFPLRYLILIAGGLLSVHPLGRVAE